MWEDATPKPVPDAGDAAETGHPAGGRPAREKAGENYVLWAQIILVALALAGGVCGPAAGPAGVRRAAHRLPPGNAGAGRGRLWR